MKGYFYMFNDTKATIPTYLIGLDTSTKSTGYSILQNTSTDIPSFKLLETGAFTNNIEQSMIQLIADFTANISRDVLVVFEVFTNTMSRNDRTPHQTSINISSIINKVQSYCATNNISIATATPFAWRKQFGLPTKVESSSPIYKFKEVVRTLGHDILKQYSIDYFKDFVTRRPEFFKGVDVVDMSDDAIEATLLAVSVLSSHLQYNNETFYNPVAVSKSILLKQFNDYC